jgi:adenylate cyclase
VRQVGRDLGVRYLLEGSVRRSGNRIRFTGQLIDATTGIHVWADRFEGEMSDVFDLQDRITESVVAVIEPNLQRAEIDG